MKYLFLLLLISNQFYSFSQSDSLGFYYGELGDLVIIRDSTHLKNYQAELAKYELDMTNQTWELLDTTILDSTINAIIQRMKNGMVENSAVGYVGIKPPQYKRFEKLKAHCDEATLINLTRHYSPVIRSYSFWALVEMDSKAVTTIYESHKNDNQHTWIQEGCIGDVKSVAQIMCEALFDYKECD